MVNQTGKHVVRVLPHRLGNNQRCAGIDSGENSHAFFLRTDEAMALRRLEGVRPHKPATVFAYHGTELLFHRLLGGPARFVGAGTQVATGD